MRKKNIAADGHASIPVTLIRPNRGLESLNPMRLWDYRELIYFLIWRDIKVRYKQTFVGFGWAVLQPVAAMLVFSLFFGRLAKMPSDGVPYPIFVLAALVPWTFFANALTQSSQSLVGSANLVRKIYFPRLVVPIAAVMSGTVDFCIAFAVLIVMMPFFDVTPTAAVVWLPLFFGMALTTSLGVGLWFSALNVQYRDVRYVVPFLIQLWLFATPIAYPSSLLKGVWQLVYGINPMAGVVEGFRWALLGTGAAHGGIMAVSALISLLLLLSGLVFFGRMEKRFADII